MGPALNFYLSIFIFLIAYIFIISEKINRMIVALLGATIMIFVKILFSDKALELIDWNVILLLIGMMLIVNMIKKIGIFEWLAIKTAKLVKGNPVYLMILLMWITAIISAFLDNVTTVLLIAPVILLLSAQMKITPIPFLITQILASNIGGTSTLIGDPPNILIGSAANLSFMDFLANLILPIFSIMSILSVAIYLIFKNKLKVSKELRAEIMSYDERGIITDNVKLWKSLGILAFVFIGFLLHNLFHYEPYLIALFGATLLMFLLKEEPEHLFADVEWTTLFFFIGLFILVGGLQESGVIKFVAEKIIKLSGNNIFILTIVILFMSIVLSAIVDNIPFVITMIPIIKQIGPQAIENTKFSNFEVLWWALALGACLGGNGTLIGASANVVVAGLAEKNGYKISFVEFLKYGVPITIVAAVISGFYLYFKYFF